MLQILLALCIIVPLLVYLRAGFKVPAKLDNPDVFYILPQMITPVEFANTSTAYGFQIASVSVFLAWGYFYGLGAFVNPLFWGVGIFLFLAFLPRVTPFLGTRMTLHGFLGTRYGSKGIRVLASAMTILGFLGLLLAELIWGSQVLTAFNPDPVFMYFATFSMGIFVTIYVARGGNFSVIRTDQYQLLFSYLGFLVVLLWLLYRMHSEGNVAQAVGLILSLALALLLWLTWRSIRRSAPYEHETEREARTIQRTISYIVVVAIGVVAVNALISLRSLPALPEALQERNLYSFAQGKWNLLSLSLLPIFWQFVDVTMWQRLSAVKLGDNPEGGPDLNLVNTGLRRYATESPLTWILAVLLGVAVRYSGFGFTEEEIWNMMVALPTKLIGAGVFEGLLAAFFTVGILSVMLSTVDSSLIGSVFTLVYDTIPKTRKQIDSGVSGETLAAGIIRVGVIASLIFVFLGLTLYFILSAFKVPILGILFGAYSAQISLFPAVFGTLWLGNRTPASGWAISSIVLGFIGAMGATLKSLYDPSWQLYPPLFSLALSIPVYVLGIILSFRKNTRGTS